MKMPQKIPLFEIYQDDDDVKAVSIIIKRGSFWAEGPEINEFENNLAQYLDVEHAVVFNNGTSALHAMLLAYGIGPGHEVVVPSFTFISTANAALFTGAKPVFCDIEREMLGLDADDIGRKITARTRAVMPIHFAGHTCQIKAIQDLAQDRKILLFEDAAESLGSTFKGKKVGGFGDASMFSFCQNKIITTGEGGAITTNDENIARKLRLIRSHGRSQGDYFNSSGSPDYASLGYNFRIPTLCAALGISQLHKVEKIIKMRREIASRYNNALSGVSDIELPNESKGCRHVYQLYSIILKTHEMQKGLKSHLDGKNIMSKVYFDPVHLSKHYHDLYGNMKGQFPVTEDISSRILTLPLFPEMKDKDFNRIIDAIREYLGD
jgi:perosamine synthetase